MKRIQLTILLLLLSAMPLLAKPGCMSKSQQLQQKFDTKAYHYVSCSCPCDSYRSKGLYLQKRNTCLQCQHQHDPRPVLILNSIPHANNRTSSFPESDHATMYRMIARWRQRSQISLFCKFHLYGSTDCFYFCIIMAALCRQHKVFFLPQASHGYFQS